MVSGTSIISFADILFRVVSPRLRPSFPQVRVKCFTEHPWSPATILRPCNNRLVTQRACISHSLSGCSCYVTNESVARARDVLTYVLRNIVQTMAARCSILFSSFVGRVNFPLQIATVRSPRVWFWKVCGFCWSELVPPLSCTQYQEAKDPTCPSLIVT